MLGRQHRNKKNCRARRIFKQRLPVLNMPWDPKDFDGRRPGTPLRNPWKTRGTLRKGGGGPETLVSKDGLESTWGSFLSHGLTF